MQNRSESQCSCIFQEPINRGKYAHMALWVKYALGESFCVSNIPPEQQKNLRTTVSVFLPTLQLTALLLKSFHLRLHCYILTCREQGEEERAFFYERISIAQDKSPRPRRTLFCFHDLRHGTGQETRRQVWLGLTYKCVRHKYVPS